MPTLDYTEFFTNIKANFIHDVVFDEESNAVIYYIKLPRVTHTYTDIAKDLDVSTTTVICMFTKTFHFGIPEYLTATLAIDELRKLKY